MKLESQKVHTNLSPEELFKRFESLANLKEIMPESVERFEADENSFLFGMKGLPDVRLVLEEKVAYASMKFKAASSKLDFYLSCLISDQGEGSEVYFDFEGNFNPMMKMMIERPLKKFIEDLAENTAKLQ
jgi:carbon monoxide dehydrogenase subunit G